MRVFITGGSGLVGSRLIKRLRERGDDVVLLTRRPDAIRDRFGDCALVAGDPMTPGPWTDALAGCDAVVNLAGENIFGKRWNDEVKRLLLDSRIRTTDNVVAALARQPPPANGAPRVLVNASAVGYYGPHGDEELTEASPAGLDFLAQICVAWEKSALAAEAAGVRVVLLRIGVVLDHGSIILDQMLLPFKLGLGGPTGSGKQWLAWIHGADVAGLILLALDNAAARGPMNATAPQIVSNRDFAKALGRALHRPAVLSTPAFLLRAKMGGVAEVVLTGQRVIPAAALRLGYPFQFPTIDAALANLLPA